MNFSNNQDGACTWTKPDNWIAYVEHFRNKFTHSNVVYPWGQNGYIAAQYQNYLYSLGDFSFCSALDIYIDTIKDWYIQCTTILVEYHSVYFHEIYEIL